MIDMSLSKGHDNPAKIKVLFLTNTYPSPDRPWAGSAVKLQEEALRKAGIHVDVLHLDRTGSGQRIYLTAYPKIKKTLLTGKYDLLHVQFGGVQAFLGALAAEKRCIVTYHGTDLHGGSPQTIWESLSYFLGVICSRYAARRSGASIVVAEHLLRYLGSNVEYSCVIPTGVDYDRFFPTDKKKARNLIGLKTEKRYVLFNINNMDPVKRRDLAEKTMALLEKEIPEAHLLTLSQVPFEKVPLFINASDVLLVTSDKEGSPNIVKEALACNLPVVSVDVGDVPDMIADVKNCSIVSREPEIIANALANIINSGADSDGREKRREIIDNVKVCQRIIEVYKTVMRKCGPVHMHGG